MHWNVAEQVEIVEDLESFVGVLGFVVVSLGNEINKGSVNVCFTDHFSIYEGFKLEFIVGDLIGVSLWLFVGSAADAVSDSRAIFFVFKRYT